MENDLLAQARALGPRIAAASDAIEAGRTLPQEIAQALAQAGCFRMCVPRVLRGEEAPPSTFLRVIEEVARADGSAGWCVMVGATAGLMAAFLDEETARELYAPDPNVVTSGVFAPMGRAVVDGDDYVVSGRWPFNSGSAHAELRMGGALVLEGGMPKMDARGVPVMTHVVFRKEETKILDTWHTSGLRGTGSNDMVVEEVRVPRRRAASMITDRPKHDGLLYRFPVFGLLALGVSAVAMGIARQAIDVFTSLATEKRTLGAKRTLAQRETTQADVARAEARLRSGRAFVFEITEEATEAAKKGDALDLRTRALLRLAATEATQASAAAVDIVYNAGGATSIYASSPLQRCFRDVHVATQHAMVSLPTFSLSGRVLLGLETDASTL